MSWSVVAWTGRAEWRLSGLSSCSVSSESLGACVRQPKSWGMGGASSCRRIDMYDQESVRAAPELSGLSGKDSRSDGVGEHGWSSHVKRCSSTVGNRNQTGPAVGWDDV